MGHCGASAHDGGDGGIHGACTGDVEVADVAETGSGPESAGSRKVERIDVRPVNLSSGKFVSATEQWRSEDRRRENNRAAVAPQRKLSATGQWLLLGFVHLYRVFLSPFLGGACKFYPSCSQYAQEAIALHGAKRGSWLALKRLGRCRPFTKGGFDPVPDSTLGYENGDGPSGLVAASRDRHDYSDAEWLRSVNKELVQ
jgi:putative membrane protein insertion efficiency factor